MDLTVRPASYVGSDTNSGGWTRSGGAASDWETLRSASDSTYLYDGTVSGSVATSFYTDCIDQDIYNGSPSTISKITVYARAKMDSHATPATIMLTERDATGTRQETGVHQNLTTSWTTYEEEFTTHHGGYGYDFGFYPDNSGFDGSELQAGFVVQHGTVGVFVSQLWIVITHEYINQTLTAVAELNVPAFTRVVNNARTLSAVADLNPSIVRGATYGRVFDTVILGIAPTINRSQNLGTWLVIASTDSGSIRTRDGSSWAVAAYDDTPNPSLPAANPASGAWLAQFDNRLTLLSPENAGFTYSLTNDIILEWTHKAFFPNLPIEFTDMFVGRDAGNLPALNFLAHDGMYYLDVFENFVFGKTELNWEYDITSGKKGMYFKGNHYATSGGQGIYELAGTDANTIGPSSDDGLPQDSAGDIVDMIGVGYWIVCAINGSSGRKSSIMKRHINGNHWHTVYKTAAVNTPITSLFWDSGTLYFGEGTNVKSLALSSAMDNVKLLPTYEVASSGELIYPWFHSRFESVPKVAHRLRSTTQDMTSTEYVDWYYRVDQETDWTLLGRFATSPAPTALSFAAAGTQFERIQLKSAPARGSTTTNRPITESVTLEYEVVPEIIWKWSINIDADKETIAALTTAVAAKTLLPFYPSGDKSGDVYYVRIAGLPRSQKGTEFGQEGEYKVDLTMVTEA